MKNSRVFLSILWWLIGPFVGAFVFPSTLSLATEFNNTPNHAYTWGRGQYLSTGQGTNANILLPTRLGTESDWAWLSLGYRHTLGLKLDGSLWSWGSGQYGRLGHGDEINQSVPKRVGAGQSWAQVSAGGHHSLAVRADGTLWSWGRNNHYQLGWGSTSVNYSSPGQVGGDTDWAAVSASDGFNLALKSDGTLWSWGVAGSWLGRTGSNQSYHMQVGSDSDWVWISAGGSHSMALKADGSLWAWGAGGDGRLGMGDTSARTVPTQVGADTDWTRVSASYVHTLALKSDGSLWSWGDGTYGALGHGDVSDRLVPTRVGADTDWVWVSAGIYQSHAMKADGTLWSWGQGSKGELGHGDTLDYQVTTQVMDAAPGTLVDAGGYFAAGVTVAQVPQPLQVFEPVPRLDIEVVTPLDGSVQFAGDSLSLEAEVQESTHAVAQVEFFLDGVSLGADEAAPYQLDWVATSGSHTLRVRATDAVGATRYSETVQFVVPLDVSTPFANTRAQGYSWGNGQTYRTGHGSQAGFNVPTQLGTDSDWAWLSPGAYHGLGLKHDGSAWSWGQGTYGALGHGDTLNVGSPKQIGADQDWEQLAGIANYSLARKTDGSLWEWGINRTSYPRMLGEDQDWTWISAGTYHLFALKDDGSLWAWGDGRQGRLGLGDTTNRLSPTRVDSDTGWAWITAGGAHSAGIKADGTLWTWGNGYAGRLGHGNTSQQTAPLQVGTDSDWAWVSAGGEHTLAVKSDGTLWSWGEGHRGRLGHGDTDDRLSPTRVGTDSDWVWVSAGLWESFAMKADGTLWSWGYGLYGHLGHGDGLDYHVPTQVVGAPTGLLVQASKTGYFVMGVTTPAVPEPLQLPQLVPQLSAEVVVPDSVQALGTTLTLDAAITGATYGVSQVEFFLDGVSLGTDTSTPYQLDWVATAGFHTLHVVVTNQLGDSSVSQAIEVPVSADLDTTFSGTSHQAYTWGRGYNGETGRGNNGTLKVPTQLGDEATWAWLSAGAYHALGLKRDGTLWSWGGGQNGRLGHGDTVSTSSPLQIESGQDWSQMSAGSDHSVAIRADGTLWSWGYNNYYQLGRGYLNQTIPTPGQVGPDNDWAWVDAAGGYNLALKTDGTLWSWGGGGAWLGRGGAANQSRPLQIGSDADWAWVSADSQHSAAVKTDGTLWTWGIGNYGRLGLGDTTARFVPTQVGTDTDWVRVSAGFGHTLALKSDGSLWSWGYGWQGAHGQGDTTDYLLPTRVGVDMDWVWVEAGQGRSYALKADGTLWSWGQGSVGELGHDNTLNYLVPTQVMGAAPGTLVDSGGYFAAGITVAQVPRALQIPQLVPRMALTMTSPQQDSVQFLGDTVSFEAEVLESTNAVSQLEFFLNGRSLGEDATAPYQLDWVATSGRHTLRAQATDATGATRYSDTVQISVPMDVSSPFLNTRAQAFSWGNGQYAPAMVVRSVSMCLLNWALIPTGPG